MKQVWWWAALISLLILALMKVRPLSAGERYQTDLRKWYRLVDQGNWEKAQKQAEKLKNEDIVSYSQKYEKKELLKQLGELRAKEDKSADDWMEISIILDKLGQYKEAYGAIAEAWNMDPIREDISKIYFTYQKRLH